MPEKNDDGRSCKSSTFITRVQSLSNNRDKTNRQNAADFCSVSKRSKGTAVKKKKNIRAGKLPNPNRD